VTHPDASVVLRIVPPEFRTPEYTVSRNNVYRLVQGDDGRVVRRLVGQLDEARQLRMPVGQAARFFGGGGQAALTALSAVGSIASTANLGVCVVGFLHVSRALRRVEARLERVEQKLDEIAELVGVIDQKVDQLLALGDAQLAALSELRNLLLSFQTAGVHRALETLEYRRSAPASAHRNAELMAAARTLHDFRLWLAHTRAAGRGRPAPARAELLRAEVLVVFAEARARCLANDAAFAAHELEAVLEGVRTEAMNMRAELLASANVPALLAASVPGVEDMHAEYAAVNAWLDRKSMEGELRYLLRETAHGYNDLAQRMRTLEMYAEGGRASPLVENLATYRAQGFFNVPSVSDADAASLIVAARLGRSLESALAVCTAIEVLGEPAKGLLESPAPAEAPALSVELEKVGG
jgi:hypothetical protein